MTEPKEVKQKKLLIKVNDVRRFVRKQFLDEVNAYLAEAKTVVKSSEEKAQGKAE